MTPKNVVREEQAHLLMWKLGDGRTIQVEPYQLDTQTWREDPWFATDEWHAIPARVPGRGFDGEYPKRTGLTATVYAVRTASGVGRLQ